MIKSITETLKKINIELTFADMISIMFTFIILSSFFIFKIIKSPNFTSSKTLSYIQSNNILSESSISKHYIYASSKGKKYYYYNCKANIKESNKIYFENDEAAIKAGYTLSKTCK